MTLLAGSHDKARERERPPTNCLNGETSREAGSELREASRVLFLFPSNELHIRWEKLPDSSSLRLAAWS